MKSSATYSRIVIPTFAVTLVAVVIIAVCGAERASSDRLSSLPRFTRPLAPDRSCEEDSFAKWRGNGLSQEELQFRVFLGERLHTDHHYGRNDVFPGSFTASAHSWLYLDWLPAQVAEPREAREKTRYFINGIDVGAGQTGIHRLLEETKATRDGTRILIPEFARLKGPRKDSASDKSPRSLSKTDLYRLLPSVDLADHIYDRFRVGQVKLSDPGNERLCGGRTVWPGHVGELPDIVLTWTTPGYDAFGWRDDLPTRYYVNGQIMGDNGIGFENALRELEKYPEGSRLLIYPFYARKGMPKCFCESKPMKCDEATWDRCERQLLRETVLRRKLKLTFVMAPTRKFQAEVDRWLLARGGDWRLGDLAPFGVVLGTFFHLSCEGEDTQWIPDVYPTVAPLVPHPSAIPLAPNWIHYVPDRSRLRAFYAKEFVLDAMDPCYCLTGVEGIESMTIDVGNKAPREYTVYLHFSEPNKDTLPHERVFSVSLQGKEALRDFDIVREANNPFRPMIKEFHNIEIGDRLTISFMAKRGKSVLCAVRLLPGSPPPREENPRNWRDSIYPPPQPRSDRPG